MARKKTDKDYLAAVRKEIKTAIEKEYRSVENFAYAHDIRKSTLYRILNGERKDCMVSTLADVAKALGKKFTLKIG